jgi:3-oxoacyl-[acyl-carrier-protein] synthase II
MIGKRVVVTGLAAVTPIGNDLGESWTNLVAGVSGAAPITRFDTTGFDTTFACEVKNFDEKAYIPHKQSRRMAIFTKFAVACGQMVLENAAFTISDAEAPRVGVIVGCGLGGLEDLETFHSKLLEQGPDRVRPFSSP